MGQVLSSVFMNSDIIAGLVYEHKAIEPVAVQKLDEKTIELVAVQKLHEKNTLMAFTEYVYSTHDSSL